MKRLSEIFNAGNEVTFGSNFKKNEILGSNAMWHIRGGDGGDGVIIIPTPPTPPAPPSNP